MEKKPSHLIAAATLILVFGAAYFYQNKRPDSGQQEAIAVLGEAITSEAPTPPEESGELPQVEAKARSEKAKRAYSLEMADRVVVPEGKALEVIDSLRPLAEAGDARAALALHMKLDRCYNAFNKEIPDDLVEKFDAAGAPGLLESRLTDLENCAGAESLLSERGKWLEQAAEAGLLEAQLLYATDPEPIIGNASDMIRDPESVQRYKAKVSDYLNRLATGGNVDAMLSLSNAYENGILLPRDPIRAYAYYKATELAMPTPPEIGAERTLEQMKQAIPKKEDRVRAEDMARRIYQECCKN